MLNVQMLDTSPQLNAFTKLSALPYIPGESVLVSIQLLTLDGIRFIPPTTATVSIGFKINDGTTSVKSATSLFPSDDRSIWQVQLAAADTAVIIGQNIIVSVDMLGDATNVQQAIGNNVLSKTLFEGDC